LPGKQTAPAVVSSREAGETTTAPLTSVPWRKSYLSLKHSERFPHSAKIHARLCQLREADSPLGVHPKDQAMFITAVLSCRPVITAVFEQGLVSSDDRRQPGLLFPAVPPTGSRGLEHSCGAKASLPQLHSSMKLRASYRPLPAQQPCRDQGPRGDSTLSHEGSAVPSPLHSGNSGKRGHGPQQAWQEQFLWGQRARFQAPTTYHKVSC
jgi:hypothetical protein